MEDRLGLLEARVGELAESVRALQARLSNLEGAGSPAASGDSTAGAVLARPPEGERASLDAVLPLVGKVVLILGGAFLVRMLTEAGTLPPRVGVFVGLVYGGFWLAWADRVAGRGRALAALLLGGTGLLIACPLLWEATTRFQALDAGVALIVLGIFTGASLWIAIRRALPGLAWAATLLPAMTVFAIFTSTRALLPATAFLIALGVATVWLADSPVGRGLRWPAAAAADLAVLVLLVVAARPGGPVGPYRGLSLGAAQKLILLLPAAYLASFASRILLSKRAPGALEALQTFLVILLGAAGARLLGVHGPMNAAALAVAGLAALGGYAAAIAGHSDSPPGRFLYLSGMALLLFLFFFGAVLPAHVAALLWSGLAVAAAAGAARWRQPDLAVHSVVYLVAAALASAFPLWVAGIYGSGQLEPVRRFPLGWVSGLCGAGLYAFLRGREPRDRRVQIAAALGGFLAILTLACGVVLFAARAFGIETSPAPLAGLRSAILALGTVGLAAAGARWKREEIAWVAWGLLVAGALKILVQDVPSGRAAVLAVSFAFYGVSLILAPRFLRAAAARTA
jgi:hypothetical protein